MSYFRFIFYLISSDAKLDRKGVNLILAIPAFELLLSSETSPSQRPSGPSLTLERKANAAIARFHKSRRRATSAKNAIWFCKKNLPHLTKTKKWKRNFFETSKAKLFLNLLSLVQQARKLKDAQAVKLTSLKIDQLKSWQVDQLTSLQWFLTPELRSGDLERG